MKTRVVVVGPKGRKLGTPVYEALLAAREEFEICGVMVRINGHGVDMNLVKFGRVLIADSFSALGRELNPPKNELEQVVVFYAVKADVLLGRVREAIQAGFRRHVIGTTGLSPDDMAELRQLARNHVVVHASNFSLGANFGAEQCAVLARQLPDAEVEIVEAHHRLKEDAPSGTALLWARAVAAARRQSFDDVVIYGRHGKSSRLKEKVCIHSLRGGGVAGFHRAIFFGPNDEFAVEHNVRSSALFGQGALRAIAWTQRAQSMALWHMSDVLNLALLKELQVY